MGSCQTNSHQFLQILPLPAVKHNPHLIYILNESRHFPEGKIHKLFQGKMTDRISRAQPIQKVSF